MQYVQILCPQTLLEDCVELLGENGVFQFVDRNRNFTTVQRGVLHTRFAHAIKEIKRCDDMERILRYMNGRVRKAQLIPTPAEPGAAQLKRFGKGGDKEASFDSILKKLVNAEKVVKDKVGILSKLTKDLNDCVELNEVLKQAKERFDDGNRQAQTDENSLLGNMDFNDDIRIAMVGGVVNQSSENGLKRQIFRASRGNAVVYLSPITGRPMYDPVTQEAVQLSVFLIFFQKSAELQSKVEKTCAAFGARMQSLPDVRDNTAVDVMLAQTDQDFRDLNKLRQSTHDQLKNILRTDIVDDLERWTIAVRSRKSVYHNITKFERQGGANSNILIAYGWILKEEENRIAMAMGRLGGGGQMATMTRLTKSEWPDQPPTYFETNKFTSVFQSIVDTYGTPRYQEANPALFEVIMFPFLFGVMYGDIGHGLIMLLSALYMVRNEERLAKPGVLPDLMLFAFDGRYMLVLMGAFSVYMGFLYNDLFSMNLPLFGTTWEPTKGNHTEAMASYHLPKSTYPFGLDPTWRTAENQLLFGNSMKMKMSVILGITQMMFGIFLRFSNAIYFRNFLDLVFECIPMLVFACSLFGYMVFSIIYKWSIDWTGPEGMGGGYGPPSIIVNLINMVLKPGDVHDAMYGRYVSVNDSHWKPGDMSKQNICRTDTNPPCGQAVVQMNLLIIAGLCVPLILLPKPLILHYCKKDRHQRSSQHDTLELSTLDAQDTTDLEGQQDPDAADHGGHGEGFGDLMIHQIIETIEFVLGMVSNTASYLRLWALSLAHGQLAEVFWEKALLSTINMNNFVAIIIGFHVWASATIGVLCLMDPLECFLHALRLHWVEFQNKFFKADGYAFEPFDLRKIDGKLTTEN